MVTITDCLIDSPYFHRFLAGQEKQIAKDSAKVATIIEHCRNIITCTKALSNAYKAFATSLYNFGQSGDSEIDSCISQISELIFKIEDERERIPGQIEEAFIKPLNHAFTSVDSQLQQEKRHVESETSAFQSVLDNYLTNPDKKPIQLEFNSLVETAVNYAHGIQSFQLSKRYEFLDSLVCLINHQMNFYHLSYELVNNSKPLYQTTAKLHNIRTTVLRSVAEAEARKEVILANPVEYLRTSLHKSSILAGNLLIMKSMTEQKIITPTKFLFGNTWARCFCEFHKETRTLYVTPSDHFDKIFESVDRKGFACFLVRSCHLCDVGSDDSNGRPFSFKVKLLESPSSSTSSTSSQECIVLFQAKDENERRLWIDAMMTNSNDERPIFNYQFLEACFDAVEKYAIDTVGLYRVPGAKPKIVELLRLGLGDDLTREESSEMLKTVCCGDVKVVTSAILAYLSSFDEPLTTFDLYDSFIYAASLEDDVRCVRSLHFLVNRLPVDNFRVLKLLFGHLSKIAVNSDCNKMTSQNLGICFGPSLFRQRHETNIQQVDLQALEAVKLSNRAVVVLIDHFAKIFCTNPPLADIDSVTKSWRIYETGDAAAAAIQNYLLHNHQSRPSFYLLPAHALGAVIAHLTSKVKSHQHQQQVPPAMTTDSNDENDNNNVVTTSDLVQFNKSSPPVISDDDDDDDEFSAEIVRNRQPHIDEAKRRLAALLMTNGSTDSSDDVLTMKHQPSEPPADPASTSSQLSAIIATGGGGSDNNSMMSILR